MKPSETWCERCPKVAERDVRTASGTHSLCREHAAMLDFQLSSKNFNGRK